jgi:hypothetical protein
MENTFDVTETPVPVTALVTDPPVVKRGPGRPRTKVTLKRVVLFNGVPVGRGRPAKEGKKDRTVVFVPVDREYDFALDGLGKPYHARHGAPIKRVNIATYEKSLVPA